MRDTSHNGADRLRRPLVGAQRWTQRVAARAAQVRVRARAIAPLLAIALAWPALRARAEPELALRWVKPEHAADCPDQAWAMARITEQLGRAPKPEVMRGVSADVSIQPGGKGFTLVLETRFQGQVGSRTLEGARCEELSEAATLVISLSVSEASEQIATAPAAPPPQQAVDSERPGGATPAPPPPPPRLIGALRVDALMQVGLWDRVALGPSLALGLTRGLFRVELAGYWYPPLTLEQQGRRIAASLGAARAIGCALFRSGRWRGGPCLGAEIGGARSDNRAETGRKDNTWWSAATVGGRLQVELVWRLSLVAAADLLVGLTRLRFSTLDENGEPQPLGESELVQLRASLGPELRF